MVYCIDQFHKISILPPRKFFCFALPLPPGNSSLALYFASKIFAFKTPLPLGIANDLPWGGYGFFLELQIPKLLLQQETRVASLDMRVLYCEIQLTSHEKQDENDNLPLSSSTVCS